MALKSLGDLDAFRVIVDVTPWASATGQQDEENLKSLVFTSCDLSRRHAWLTWNSHVFDDNGIPCGTSYTVSAGLRKEGYFCGIHVYPASPAAKDKLLRAALFKRAIEILELERSISIVVEKEILRMNAVAPWSLQYPSADIKGDNPSAFNVCGFADINVALAAGCRLTSALGEAIARIRYIAKFDASSYQQVVPQLNARWKGWYLEVVGALTQKAVDILCGRELDEESPSRIPAFRWCEEENGSQVFGAVVIEENQRYLEIATDGGTLEMLQERVGFLQDVHFEPVYP